MYIFVAFNDNLTFPMYVCLLNKREYFFAFFRSKILFFEAGFSYIWN